MRVLVLVVLSVSLLVAGCAGAHTAAPSAPSALLGQPLKDFKRSALSGEAVDTASLRGRVVVVKFFATYCKPCERTLPEVEALHRELGDVVFVGVDEDSHASDAEALVKKHGLTFPVVLDSGQVLAGRFRVAQMPVTFVVDKQGSVRWVADERHTADDLRAAIDAAAR